MENKSLTRIDPAIVQKIKDTADIVEVVGDYVHLIRSGANYKGLCPFHNERTPSFSVNRARNFCYCFSCKKGGSPVNFIMEKEGLTYAEALRHLANRYGIKIEERELTDEERARQSERESMFVANEWAMKLMEHDLLSTEEGQDIGLTYLTQRGVTEEAIKAFHLGYALDSRDHLRKMASRQGINIDVLKSVGLVGTSQQGVDYDRFRGRVIFPVLSTSGKVIAFGGRTLKNDVAKYVNSPESTIYKKSNELYGIFQARQSMVKEQKCFLVEGYMDVIGMWQAGMKNVVASSGTALTDGQIALIHRFTNNVTLIYDGDAAGIKASLRGIDMLLRNNMNVKVLRLPPEHDPDSFARTHSHAEFQEYVKEHETDIIRFKARVLLTEAGDDPQRRITAVNSVAESIANINDQVARDVYIQECSLLMHVSEENIAANVAAARARLLGKARTGASAAGGNYAPGARPSTPTPTSISTGNNADNSTSSAQSQPLNTSLPLLPLEKQVVKLCVRYAYLPFCRESDTSERMLNVLQFVSEELEADEITFTVETFKRIFNVLTEHSEAFETALQQRIPEIEKDIEKERSDAYEEFASKDLSVSEIQKSEKLLEFELMRKREVYERNFIKDYSARLLASHEDDGIRRVATELLHEPHQLSHIYTRNNTTESEEDALPVLLPRALTEWKNEILNLRLSALFNRMKELSESGGDSKELENLQLAITSIMKHRSTMAKYIGERVIFARHK